MTTPVPPYTQLPPGSFKPIGPGPNGGPVIPKAQHSPDTRSLGTPVPPSEEKTS